MLELTLEEVLFKQKPLVESIRCVLRESAWDYINYGVTQRAIDSYFGGGKKLSELVKEEMLKKYGKTDISKLDPNELANEIRKKADSAAGKLMKSEFFSGLKKILADGLLNGILNAFVNSLLTLVLTLNPEEAIKNFFRGFVVGVLVEFLFKGFKVIYNEFKKRILKDPYAQPSTGETLVIILLTIVTFTTAIGLYAGQGPEYIIISILINIFLTTIMTILLNIKAISEKLTSYFNSPDSVGGKLVEVPKQLT